MKVNPKRILMLAGLLIVTGVLAWYFNPFTGPCMAEENLPARQQSNPPEGQNRLALETSPYLLMHATNPVDWFPWGGEAFDKARKEDKPIFLSVGYSTCYWCQVMERESFSDSATGELLNQHFVSIKVDREERPDVDKVYMAAVLRMIGSGGWPMSVFLTPDLKPFFGGTYFPNADFKAVLRQIQQLWQARKTELMDRAEAVTKSIQADHVQPAAARIGIPPAKFLEEAVRRFAEVFDQTEGGFGPAPKFPQPSVLQLLLYDFQENGNAESLAMVRKTLDAMARGGIYDQVAGGFHRYSTDRRWLVPHFEKMLYDNAQLLYVYARAYRLTGDDDFRRTAGQIADYVGREMTGPRGLFFSAQDSGVEGQEGETYVWELKTLMETLSSEEFALAGRVFGFFGEPDFKGRYVLHWPDGFEATARRENLDRNELFNRLDPIRGKLLAARKKQDQPRLDDKSITAWNGLMIEALAYAGETLKRPEYVRMAEAAAEELLRTLRDKNGNLLHVARQGRAKLDAYLDDYAAVILGMLELNRATGKVRWRDEAARLADAMIEKLWDPAGGFHYALPTIENLVARPKATFDGAFPAGNSLAVRALAGLAAGGLPRFAPYAAGTLRTFGDTLERTPTSMPYMLWGLSEYRLKGLSEEVAMPAAKPRLPKTSDVVRIMARLSPAALAAGLDAGLEVTIATDKGWHIVANPPLLDSLLPATVQAEIAGGELQVVTWYPSGKKIDSILGEVAIYEDGVSIPARVVPVRLPSDRGQDRLVVSLTAQACNDTGRCLAPSTIRKEIPVSLQEAGRPE